jgi:hypothetical protein
MFAGWVARGSVGYPLFDRGKPAGHPDEDDYRKVLSEHPSQMETMFAIFANLLELDENGDPVNTKYAERRAAVSLYEFITREPPDGESTTFGTGEGTLY